MFETSGRPEGTKAEIYEELARQASGLFHGERDAIANAANLAALIAWGLADLNWAGFYILRGDELVLGPFVGKPACVRIAPGRGVCGTAAAERRSVLVEDVHAFPGHIACDADDYRRRFPDGRIGSDPSQATPEKGERIIAAAARALAADYERFLASA